ncbi:uncharacterized protein TNCV_4096041 [Trichonephila clavipes]|nr:uncharacterized protein TNCV_4096041 [Trichonephila clavipes]
MGAELDFDVDSAFYRAIHLELLTSISTESFLLGLRRFIARRGRPSVIYSNNSTNFKGAYRLYQKVNLEKIEECRRAINQIHGNSSLHRFSWRGDANEGSHLPINIDHELSKTPRGRHLFHAALFQYLMVKLGLEPRAGDKWTPAGRNLFDAAPVPMFPDGGSRSGAET